jgi:hypothetical protein
MDTFKKVLYEATSGAEKSQAVFDEFYTSMIDGDAFLQTGPSDSIADLFEDKYEELMTGTDKDKIAAEVFKKLVKTWANGLSTELTNLAKKL